MSIAFVSETRIMISRLVVAVGEAARSTISLRSQDRPARPKPVADPRSHEPGWWPGLDKET